MFRKFFVAIPVVILAVGSTACATKKFVRTSVGEVNEKVDSQGRTIEETQERVRKNEGRISEVDQRAQAAAQSAQQANDAASTANTAATRTRSTPALNVAVGGCCLASTPSRPMAKASKLATAMSLPRVIDGC